MDRLKLSYSKIPQLSERDIAYQTETTMFEPFYSWEPNLDSFGQAIAARQKKTVDRALLHKNLKDQYQNIKISKQTSTHIDLLKEDNTFTIVTAHQLSVLTGPLYYITKIVSCIRLCQRLKIEYPEYNFIPIFVHGSEDHDFDEIAHIHLFGKTLSWTSNESGPVGRFSKEGLSELLDQLKNILQREQNYDYVQRIVDEAYDQSTDYKSFVLRLVQPLFDDYGLVQLNMDRPSLKKAFTPILKKEILERASKDLVLQQQLKIEKIGFKSQAYPRDINLFLLSDGSRDRISYEDGMYHIIGRDLVYSEDEILHLLDTAPERFSPNVVIRPLYQEYILPNLAYVGGGGELAYWLERKTQFEHFDIHYPILVRRDSVLLLDKKNIQQIQNLGFEYKDLFKSTDELINDFLHSNTEDNINLSRYIEQNNELFAALADLATQADPSLNRWVLSEKTKQEKVINQIEGRIKRAYKSKEEVNINKIKKLKDKLFPKNGMQERHDNSLAWIAKMGPSFIGKLITELDPLDKSFKVIQID